MSGNETGSFELVLAVRDNLGRPTTRTKSVVTDHPSKLWNFYQNTVGIHEYKDLRKKSRNNSKSPDALAEAEVARELLKLIYGE